MRLLMMCAAVVTNVGAGTLRFRVILPEPDTSGCVLVPIPRLCRVVPTAPGADELVAGGRVFCRFPTPALAEESLAVARAVEVELACEPVPESLRREREARLWNTQGSPLPEAVLVAPGTEWWYGPADTSIRQFFGGSPPADFHFRELARMPLRSDIVVGVGVGGWGLVPLEQTTDLLPTVQSLHDSLLAWGFDALVVPYYRAEDRTFPSKFTAGTEMVGIHHRYSSRFARDIGRLFRAHSGMRLVLIGLSNGATFIGQVIDRLAPEERERACAVMLGPPFWHETPEAPDVLMLDNHGEDPLPTAAVEVTVGAMLAGLWRYIGARLQGRRPHFEEMYRVPGHDYSWSSVAEEVVPFLRERLGLTSLQAGSRR